MTPSQILAEPVRSYLIELLCSGATTSGDLATMCFSRFGVGWSSVSRHIGRLERAGFIRRIDDGAERWVALEPDWLERAARDVDRLRAVWDAERASRRLGVAGELYDATACHDDGGSDLAAPRTAGARGRRGRAQFDRAAFGLRRATDSRSADGGGAFE